MTLDYYWYFLKHGPLFITYIIKATRMKIFLKCIIILRANYSSSSSVVRLKVDITQEIYFANALLKFLHKYTGDKLRYMFNVISEYMGIRYLGQGNTGFPTLHHLVKPGFDFPWDNGWYTQSFYHLRRGAGLEVTRISHA